MAHFIPLEVYKAGVKCDGYNLLPVNHAPKQTTFHVISGEFAQYQAQKKYAMAHPTSGCSGSGPYELRLYL